MDSCLLCLEEINCTDNLSCPSHCKCKVSLHLECLKMIEATGLLCPICRIKKSQKVIIIRYDGNSYLLRFANNIMGYFFERPNIFSFTIIILMSCIVSVYLLPQILWLALNDSKYRSTALAFIGIGLFMVLNKLFYL